VQAESFGVVSDFCFEGADDREDVALLGVLRRSSGDRFVSSVMAEAPGGVRRGTRRGGVRTDRPRDRSTALDAGHAASRAGAPRPHHDPAASDLAPVRGEESESATAVLPPVRSRPMKKKSVLTLLKEDHAKVRKLLEQLDKAQAPGRRDELLEKISQEVEVHTRLEEEIFYPAFHEASRKKEDGKLFHEAIAEHGAVKLILPDLLQTERDSEEFAGKAKVLKDLIEHHAEEEEKELFPRAKALLSDEELQDLGARVEERKQQLMVGV
jgi:hemerythrin-like domain-containing protein